MAANRTTLSSIICCCLCVITSCGADNHIRKGEKFYAVGDYFDAGEQFKKAYSKTPAKERKRRGEIALRQAECYKRINASQKAVAAYRNAVRYKTATTETHLDLGRQLLKTGDYKSAATEFRMVLDSMPDNILAKNGLASAENAPA